MWLSIPLPGPTAARFQTDDVAKLFGLGVAILVDATVVWMVLVPATMELRGERNWWLGWLERALPRLNVEVDDGSGDDARQPVLVS